jgi:catechol 2,3-dioxygenase-like lactoylglutathione lyase family enzyme
MPRLIHAVTALCFALSLPAPEAMAAGTGPSLLRTTLTVADVDRSARFYSLLGFTVEDEMGGERNPDSPFPLNSRSTQWRLVILAPASGEGGKIGLLSFDASRPAPAREMSRERIGLGDMVFVLDVPDARAVHATLVEAGADVVEAPLSYTSRKLDPEGRPMQGWVFHAFDPDGYLVEVLEAPRPQNPGSPDPAPRTAP